MFYERIKFEHDRIAEEITAIENELNTLPKGKLICTRDRIYTKWYVSDGHRKTYIPKSNRTFAEQLAKKKYLMLKMEDLKKEKKALAYYLKRQPMMQKADAFLEESSEYLKLLEPVFQPRSKELAEWMAEEYDKNENHPENLIHKGVSNNYLRSKSEVMIDMMLCKYQIPFRYECGLSLGGMLFYPDFTIRHPRTGEYYYWEHFGMMDCSSYIANATAKINLYATNGITPGIRLITTYETKTEPLSMDMIESYIRYYFC